MDVEMIRTAEQLFRIATWCHHEAEYLIEHEHRGHTTWEDIADPVSLFVSAGLMAERAADQVLADGDLNRADAVCEALIRFRQERSVYRRMLDNIHGIIRTPDLEIPAYLTERMRRHG